MTSRDSPCGGFRALVGGSSFCGCYERASALVMTAHRQDTQARTEFSSCLMPATAFAPPPNPPLCLTPTHRTLSSCWSSASSSRAGWRACIFRTTYSKQQTPLTLLSPAATALCFDISLYPPCTCSYIQGILVYRTLNALFYKASGSSEEVW